MGTSISAGARSRDAFVRLPYVLSETGLSRSTIYSLIKLGLFPPAVKLATRVTGWRVGDLRDWLSDPQGWSLAPANDNNRGEA